MFKGWKLRTVEVPITVSLAAYTAGDAVGGLLTCTAPHTASARYIDRARLVDGSGQAEPYVLYVFDSAPTTYADADECALVEADWLKLITVLDLSAARYDTRGVDSCAFASGKDKLSGEYHMINPLTGDTLYFYLVPLDTPDLANVNDMTLHLFFMVE